MSASKLFQPIKVGNVALQHRVVLAPLTRFRANESHVPSPLAPLYYSQRASTPGSLLITEATFIAPEAGGYSNAPGIYTDEQISTWKTITDAVHAKGSFIFLQLWALGRAANPEQLAKEDPLLPYVSASDVKLSDVSVAPRALTVDEIHKYVQLYATAASNAVHRAGFDGVELHGANGYLMEQFLKDVTNKRTDEYGGTEENRTRFPLEVVDAIVKAVGEKKTGIRLSPWSAVYEMRVDDPVPTYSHLVTELRSRHPNLAYIHVVEPRVDDHKDGTSPKQESNDFIRAIWGPRRLISAGGFSRESAVKFAEEKDNLIAFGRHFISNPDLPYRLRENIPLTVGNRKTYYGNGSTDPTGYTSYPFATIAQLEPRL